MKRPTSVIILGLLNLLIAIVMSFGIYGVAFEMPVPQVLKDNPTLLTVMHMIITLRFIGLIMLFLAGIGLLLFKPWGRRLTIAYSGYMIVMGFIGFLFAVHVNDLIGKLPHDQVLVGAVLSEGVGLIYPALLLLFMFRSNVVAAFGPQHDDDDSFIPPPTRPRVPPCSPV
jgi:hypothetical protein